MKPTLAQTQSQPPHAHHNCTLICIVIFCSIPSCDPTGTGPEPADKEAELKQQAASMLLPEWKRRLSNALVQQVEIDIDLDKILACGPQDAKTRIKTLRMLLLGAKSAVEQGMALAKQESTLPIIEAVVQAVELVTQDATVRANIAARMTRVSFAPCTLEVRQPCWGAPHACMRQP